MPTPVEIVQQFEDAFVAGDMETVLSLVDPHVVIHEAPGTPYPGDHHGHDGFNALTAGFLACWEIQSPLQLDIVPAGEHRALALVEFDVIARLTGTKLRLRIAEVYTIAGGRIVDLDVYYWDGATIAAATGGVKVVQGATR